MLLPAGKTFDFTIRTGPEGPKSKSSEVNEKGVELHSTAASG